MTNFDPAIDSWKRLTNIPKYEEVAGELLFRNLFKIAPEAFKIFSFTEKYEVGSEEVYSDENFKAHATGVIKTVNGAIEMVAASEVPALLKVLKDLGKKHATYGALPEHYDLVGQSLIQTLNDALQDKFSNEVKESWLELYKVIEDTMIEGADYQSIAIPGNTTDGTGVIFIKIENFDPAIDSWKRLTNIPKYEEVAGELLFRNLFKIAPEAFKIFSFTEKYEVGSEEVYSDENFKAHATGVIKTVNGAIEMLAASEVPALLKVLKDLGKKHVTYGALPEHYDLVGQSLIQTLNDALQDKFTDDVKESWLELYKVIEDTMTGSTDYQLIA